MQDTLNDYQRFIQDKRFEGVSLIEAARLWRERRSAPPSILEERRREMEQLFPRFIDEFARTDTGRRHLESYEKQREEARKNYQLLVAASRAGEDITDRALLWLLPYAIHDRNKERGAWQCIAPTFASDIRAKFEGAEWARAEDWPAIARLVFEFVQRCIEHPEQLVDACQAFTTSDYSKGLQTGSLSPILNALRPDDFAIINAKSRKVIKALTGSRFYERIADYPNSNAAVFAIVQELSELLEPIAAGARSIDAFDMFCHWMVAVERYFKQGGEEEVEDAQYWRISPGHGAQHWDRWVKEEIATIGWNELGDVSGLSHKEFSARRAPLLEEHPDWTRAGAGQVRQFSQIQVGDRVVANRGVSTVLGIGTVVGGYFFDPTGPHHHKLKVRWDDLREREVGRRAWRKTLNRLSEEEFAAISEVDEAAPSVEKTADGTHPIVSLSACAEATGFTEPELARWIRAIERKGQAILYGPPGTGKTFVAQRLADHLVGGGTGFLEIVQFHPAYAYEDFIQGLRPVMGEKGSLSYQVVPGRFIEFCRRAEASRGRSVLILDEINRADLSRVFGELMFLLEYRDREMALAAGGTLRIPANVRIIGTMNTADRSIALVDHALRRRFAFIALAPSYALLESYHAETGFPVERLVETLKRVNAAVGDHNYEVGVSFFLRENLADHIEDIWRMEIEPYLEEYFFDSPAKVDELRWAKVGKGITG